MSEHQRAEALEQPLGHSGGWSFRMEVVKCLRGITCCNASKRRPLRGLHSKEPCSTLIPEQAKGSRQTMLGFLVGQDEEPELSQLAVTVRWVCGGVRFALPWEASK